MGEARKIMFREYSTTTTVTGIATKVTIMDAMRKYFSYGMKSKCGFPHISLEGTLDDWESLRKNAKKLLTLCLPKFGEWWGEALLPVLKHFEDSYKMADAGKNIPPEEQTFWNSMI